MATIQRDRFVSLGASFDGGRITTKPVRITGDGLHLNADCDFGEILITVRSPDGAVIARSRPICSDSLDVEVEWEEGGLTAAHDEVVLDISLKNALLYALWSP